MGWLTDVNAWIGLVTLTGLEIVLGIDNIIFISILAGRLPAAEQPRARSLGLTGALFTRILLLLSIAWIVRLTAPLFTIGPLAITWRGVILVVGGLFLIGKATHEIHEKLEGPTEDADRGRRSGALWTVVGQIMVIDVVFSLDSVVTAVGMVSDVVVMIAANVAALGVMLRAAGALSAFVDRHPTVRMLALAFLVLIGANLVADGFGHHIPRGYTYFAMFFSVAVEMLNLRQRQRQGAAVRLHETPRLSPPDVSGAS